MDPLEITYESMTAIPSGFEGLYEEKEGKAVLTKVSGLKTQADIDRMNEALRKERNDHSAVKESLKAWGDLKPDEVRAQLDRIPALEAGQGQIDDDKIEGIVSSRIEQKTAPLNRQIEEFKTQNETLQAENTALKQSIERRDLTEEVRAVATEMKVLGTAIADAEMMATAFFERDESGKFVTKTDVVGIDPGLDIKAFMKEMQKQRPHWWPASNGGGAGGGAGGGISGGPNPWSKDNWNMTQQGQIIKEKGMDVAKQMAKAAGTTVGGLPPSK